MSSRVEGQSAHSIGFCNTCGTLVATQPVVWRRYFDERILFCSMQCEEAYDAA